MDGTLSPLNRLRFIYAIAAAIALLIFGISASMMANRLSGDYRQQTNYHSENSLLITIRENPKTLFYSRCDCCRSDRFRGHGCLYCRSSRSQSQKWYHLNTNVHRHYWRNREQTQIGGCCECDSNWQQLFRRLVFFLHFSLVFLFFYSCMLGGFGMNSFSFTFFSFRLLRKKKTFSQWSDSFSSPSVFCLHLIRQQLGSPEADDEAAHVENISVMKRRINCFLSVSNRWRVISPSTFVPMPQPRRPCPRWRRFVSSIIAVSSFRQRRVPGERKWTS